MYVCMNIYYTHIGGGGDVEEARCMSVFDFFVSLCVCPVRHTDRQTERWREIQTDRQTDRQRDREIDTDANIIMH